MDYKKCFITFQKCNITKKHLIKTKKNVTFTNKGEKRHFTNYFNVTLQQN